MRVIIKKPPQKTLKHKKISKYIRQIVKYKNNNKVDYRITLHAWPNNERDKFYFSPPNNGGYKAGKEKKNYR